MPNDEKVVPLSKMSSALVATAPLARLPVVLLQGRDKAAQQLKEALQALFDNADDTLFEMADRARSNTEQGIFFEAMRDLRLKRKSIERGFLDNFYESFLSLGQYRITEPVLPAAFSFDKLALVQTDDLEKTVAVDAMVANVMSRASLALGQLTSRLNAFLTPPVTDESNPVGPAFLCLLFLD
ncbi:DUF1631 family protein, partial [Pseudomonas syringae]|uniref:DUF1631 family protein n=1 Tax=Pseudomonas syringae TaxID=317 RepID=UPI0011B0426E